MSATDTNKAETPEKFDPEEFKKALAAFLEVVSQTPKDTAKRWTPHHVHGMGFDADGE